MLFTKGRSVLAAAVSVAVTLMLSAEPAHAQCQGSSQQQSSLRTSLQLQNPVLTAALQQQQGNVLLTAALQRRQNALLAAALQQRQNALLTAALQQRQNALLAAVLQQQLAAEALLPKSEVLGLR